MNYTLLKDAIAEVIKQNGNEEITGDLLQQTLKAMVNALGLGYQFMGEAKPATNPGTPDARVFYVATEQGEYTNFGVTLSSNQIAFLIWGSAWSAIVLDIPTKTYVDATFLKIADLASGTGESAQTTMTQAAITEALNSKLATSKVVQELGEDATKVVSQAALTILLSGLAEEIAKCARTNGNYPELIAGAATNLVGRGAVPAVYTRRTSGGSADIGSGSATIIKHKGKTLMWNQLANGFASGVKGFLEGKGLTVSEDANGDYILNGTISGSAPYFLSNNNIDWVSGHKYLCLNSIATGINLYATDAGISIYNGACWIVQASAGASHALGIYIEEGNTLTNYKLRRPQIFDLTLMFGAGNEPSMIAEFEALYPLPYYAYNPGQLVSNKATKIKTNGFNQWDEEWEEGAINGGTGETQGSASQICSKNFMPVIAGKDYYLPASIYVCWAYDANKIPLQRLSWGGTPIIVTIPVGACYIRFDTLSTYGTTYNHDICINLSWSGYRNGEYEPYWESELELNLATMTGKKDGVGESGVVFPNGMWDFNGAYDEAAGKQAIKRIGFRAYQEGDENDSSVKTDGTNTIYVLATPETYILDSELQMNYRVDNFGTETRLPVDIDTIVNAPIDYDVQYAMNAVDTLRRLPVNYISKASFDAFCSELATKLGAAINKNISITAIYNAEQGKYNYTITITEPSA